MQETKSYVRAGTKVWKGVTQWGRVPVCDGGNKKLLALDFFFTSSKEPRWRVYGAWGLKFTDQTVMPLSLGGYVTPCPIAAIGFGTLGIHPNSDLEVRSAVKIALRFIIDNTE